MINRYNNTSLILGVPGLVMQVAGRIMMDNQEPALQLGGSALVILGAVMLIAGFSYYAMAKGRSPLWGLCGFLSCFGLIILALLKDQAPNE